jgi:hypothetical protein
MRYCQQDALSSEKLRVFGIVYVDWRSLVRVGEKEEQWRLKFQWNFERVVEILIVLSWRSAC